MQLKFVRIVKVQQNSLFIKEEREGREGETIEENTILKLQIFAKKRLLKKEKQRERKGWREKRFVWNHIDDKNR